MNPEEHARALAIARGVVPESLIDIFDRTIDECVDGWVPGIPDKDDFTIALARVLTVYSGTFRCQHCEDN